MRWNLDRVQMGYLALFFVIAAAVLWYSYRRASTPILRQQLKWVTRGTILAIAPFTLFYVIPYLTGSMPSSAMKVSVLSLGLLPLTFGYAIFRYRLMDVDLIFKRGMVYTLAAAAIVGLYFAVVAGVAELVHTQVPSSGPVGLDAGDGGHGAAVRSRPQMDSGADRPVLLSHPLRLSQDADRIWTRAERGDRSRPDAEFGGRSPVANFAGRSHGDFSLRRRAAAVLLWPSHSA